MKGLVDGLAADIEVSGECRFRLTSSGTLDEFVRSLGVQRFSSSFIVELLRRDRGRGRLSGEGGGNDS